MAVIVVVFIGMAVLFYLYDQRMQEQIHSHDHLTPPNSDDIFNVGSGQKQTLYAMSSAGSIGGASGQLDNPGAARNVKRVSSLLKKPLKNINKSLRNLNSKSSAQQDLSSPEAQMMSGMASTESINAFLGAVKREGGSFLSDDNVGTIHQTKPVAEFFAETTVMFGKSASTPSPISKWQNDNN